MQHWGLWPYQFCPNDDPWLNLTYFKSRSQAFVWDNGKTVDFSEAIVAYDIKVDLCNDIGTFYKYQRSKLFTDLGPRSLRFNSFKIFCKTIGGPVA